MKKSVVLLLCLLLSYLFSCRVVDKTGGIGNSSSIKQSKKVGAFLFEYKLKSKYTYLNDTTPFKVHQAWLENCYTWDEFNNPRIFNNTFYFNILMDTTSHIYFNSMCCKKYGGYLSLVSKSEDNSSSNNLGGYIDNIDSPIDSIPVYVLDTIWNTTTFDSTRLKVIWFYKQ